MMALLGNCTIELYRWLSSLHISVTKTFLRNFIGTIIYTGSGVNYILCFN